MKAYETGKSILIAVLTLLAVVLSYQAWFYGSPENAGGADPFAGTQGISDGGLYLPVPFEMAVKSSGQIYGVRADRQTIESMFGRIITQVSEAVGSAGASAEIDAQAMTTILSGDNIIYLDFYNKIPLAELSGWVGDDPGEGTEDRVGKLVLSADADGIISMTTIRDGQYFTSRTALELSTLSSFINGITPNGCYFAFQDERLSGIAPDILINPEAPSIQAVTAQRHLSYDREQVEAILKPFGMNPYNTESYTDAKGTEVYVENLYEARFFKDGSILLRAPEDRIVADESNRINIAYTLINGLLADFIGESGVYYIGGGEDERNDTVTLYFGQESGGVPLQLPGGYAAAVTFRRGSLVQVDLFPCKISVSGDVGDLLPQRQAAALLGAGERMELCYERTGDEYVPAWKGHGRT